MSDETADENIRSLLLDSLLGIPFAVDWNKGKFVYVGPQIIDMLGYSPSEWVSMSDWVDCCHPDDGLWAQKYCHSKCEEGLNHEFEYRMIKKNGDIVWVRDVVNVINDNAGKIQYLFGFILDITNDKVIQNQIISDKNEYQKLSLQDDLTKLYNRRKFDSYLVEQWSAAARNEKPISLVMVDIDYFKNYNDFYGHLKGDDALIHVARLLSRSFKRQQDIVCRIGGEELAVILPETTLETAKALSMELIEDMKQMNIPHENSSAAPFLTISIGVGETLPSTIITSQEFHANVDELLYSAKDKGRNCVEARVFE